MGKTGFIFFVVCLGLLGGCQKSEPEKSTPYTYITGPTSELERITYDIEGNLAIAEGDILLGTVEEAEKLKTTVESSSDRGATSRKYRSAYWPKGIVPYEMSESIYDSETILDAMKVIESVSGVSFKKRTSETDYIHIQPHEEQCTSKVGRVGGAQNLFLTEYCSSKKGKVLHELLHALGLFHEQSRNDRDEHIEINWDNIADDKKHNFDLRSPAKFFGDYDLGSIMHYSLYAFSKNDLPTMTCKKNCEQTIGQREKLSAGDKKALQALYGR